MTWPWPWPVHSMAFTLKQYLRLTFESVSAEFGPVWVKLAVLRTKMLKRSILTFDLTLTWHVTFEPSPRWGGGPKGPPLWFFANSSWSTGNFLWNLPYLSGQQFHTLCQKIRTQVIIVQPWVTSEWRHVSPILTNEMGLRESPPLVQF